MSDRKEQIKKRIAEITAQIPDLEDENQHDKASKLDQERTDLRTELAKINMESRKAGVANQKSESEPGSDGHPFRVGGPQKSSKEEYEKAKAKGEHGRVRGEDGGQHFGYVMDGFLYTNPFDKEGNGRSKFWKYKMDKSESSTRAAAILPRIHELSFSPGLEFKIFPAAKIPK